MGRKVWSGLLIGIALGIFVTVTLYTYVFPRDRVVEEDLDAHESRENEGQEEVRRRPSEETSEESMEEGVSVPVLNIEIQENHSIEELVYDLMVEGVITSKEQQQHIYEVLTYESLTQGPRRIPLYASTEEILDAIMNP